MSPLLKFGLVNAAVATLLAGGVAFVGWRDRRPTLVHLLWLLVLAKLLTPPLVKIGVDLPIPSRASASFFSAATWLPAMVGGVWICGSIAWIARQGWLAWRFRRLLRRASLGPAALQEQADRLARQFGLPRSPEVLVLPARLPPLLYGVGPWVRLVMPAGLLARIDADSRAALLAHELAHFVRGDHWVRALELVVTSLYWWHPVVWWARRRIEEAEEECCDAWVVEQGAAPRRVYAQALLETIDFLAEAGEPLPAAATGLGQAGQLRQRLIQIMRGATPGRLSGAGRVGVLLLAATFLPVYPVISRVERRDVASPARGTRLPGSRAPTSRIGIRTQFRRQTTSSTSTSSPTSSSPTFSGPTFSGPTFSGRVAIGRPPA